MRDDFVPQTVELKDGEKMFKYNNKKNECKY